MEHDISPLAVCLLVDAQAFEALAGLGAEEFGEGWRGLEGSGIDRLGVCALIRIMTRSGAFGKPGKARKAIRAFSRFFLVEK